MSDKYDKNGKPLSLMAWATLLEDRDYKRVASSQIGQYLISTVWLGLNHNYDGGKPLIFETMVFGPDDEEYTERYSTEAEALAGHKRAVKIYTNKAKVDAEV